MSAEIKNIKKIGKVGSTRLRVKRPTPIEAPETEGGVKKLSHDKVREIARALGDDPEDQQTAKRVFTLMSEFPYASMPELVVYDYLKQRNLYFQFQREFDGGRQIRGGVVADFVVESGNRTATVLMVQGEYWHTQFGARERDEVAKYQVLGQYVHGMRITQVIELWENKVLSNVQLVVELALAGLQMGR